MPPLGPLSGIRIVDCSTVLAGPYCTMLLGDLGADVVKVEPPAGDATRGWGPPWLGDEAAGTRTAAYYLSVNRNKRSLRLDLSRDAGRDVLRALLRRADAVVENFRVGGFERLGFSDAALAELNPDLVHLAISGFGTSGPDAAKPGYDFTVQAGGGLMSITGEPGGRPLKVGVAISDVVTGTFGAVAVLAALVGRGRRAAAGQRIDVSLLESTLAVLVNQAQNAIVTGRGPVRRGNAHPSIVPYETFATADGEIAVGVGSERQWPRFCAAIGLPELAAEPRFAKNGDRVEHRDELIPRLARRFATEPTATWLARLDEAAVPCAPIRDVREALDSAQARALGSVVELAHPELGRVDQVAPPFRLAATPAAIRTPPPLVGEHSDEILAEAGYDAPAIARLRAEGVI
ncbi:MAG TPA: CoA transferase [Candidatus Deferrimicrobiaceae bacterium]|nr:CoA transferase [Candidatus Deferrimicrobiaceae bacterium]